ncbi:hypothetical protein NDU88_003672 [Pleurodeles waltl]|uniref:Uncharacterized protein n=1 Tax=Pleurodeles waltl TaxID=8319 RepID=A0AAV7KX52_PLEWA|nr:hypothetical protein NDU88_003672 [Pleurodeles waltl]
MSAMQAPRKPERGQLVMQDVLVLCDEEPGMPEDYSLPDIAVFIEKNSVSEANLSHSLVLGAVWDADLETDFETDMA